MTRQLEIAGAETPGKDPDIERALDNWFEAKDEQRRAGDKAKLRHAELMLHMTTKSRPTYPYVDPRTGKKRQARVKADPKVVTEAAAKPDRRDRDADIGEEVPSQETAEDVVAKLVAASEKREKAKADRVESRRVSRESVADEIDPFARTRAMLDDDGNGTEH